MLRISQCPWRLAKLGLQMNSSQQRFLNKRKKASVKNSNTEAGPVPLALFWSEFYSPPQGPQRALEIFQSSKRKQFWPTYAFQWFPWIPSLFHTIFDTKTFLSQRDHSHTVRVTNAQLKKNAGPISQNSSFMLFKAVKTINSAPLQKFQRY